MHARHGVYLTTELTFRTAHAPQEVLARSQRSICKLHPKKQRHYCCVTAVSVGSAMRGETCGMAARGKQVCLRLLGLLESPSSLLARALPTLGSASSVGSGYSKTTGVTGRISNMGVQCAVQSFHFSGWSSLLIMGLCAKDGVYGEIVSQPPQQM